MTYQITKTLDALKKRTRKGITPLDFPTGFRLGAYIHVLRSRGYEIATMESGHGKLARYVLIKEPTL